MFGRMKDPVEGTATLVSYTETGGRHHSGTRVTAQVVLHAPGMDPQPVEVNVRIPSPEMPLAAGEVWNVAFDRGQPSHVKFAWAVSDELDNQSQREVDSELMADEVRVLKAGRRRASK
jgi:hypothetical protein